MKKVYILILVILTIAVISVLMPRTSQAPTKNGDAPVSQPTTVPALLPVAGDITLGVGQMGKIGDLSIAWNEPIQDSRCPKSVQCIWAGEVKVSVALEDGPINKTIRMSLNKPASLFNGHEVSVTAVQPYPTASRKISTKDYQITFHVAVAKQSN